MTPELPEPPEPRLRRRPRSADGGGSAPDGRAGGLLLVHAHPDDESFSTGGLIARSITEGRRVDLVTCTGGEEGEIHDPDLDPSPICCAWARSGSASCGTPARSWVSA